ncbi:hypothetical protein J3A83DRAFT_4376990 [Scleroderma citrinum]
MDIWLPLCTSLQASHNLIKTDHLSEDYLTEYSIETADTELNSMPCVHLTDIEHMSAPTSGSSQSQGVALDHEPMLAFDCHQFRLSVQRAVRCHLIHYAGPIDSSLSSEIEQGVVDSIKLALKIIKRSHRNMSPASMLPTPPPASPSSASTSPTSTPAPTIPAPTTPTLVTPLPTASAPTTPVLFKAPQTIILCSLKAIQAGGQQVFTVLTTTGIEGSTITSQMPGTWSLFGDDM